MKIRRLHEDDWKFLPSWWQAYGQEVPERSFLPNNGLGGFIIESQPDRTPIAAHFLWTTNSDTCIPAVLISDRFYRDTNKQLALQKLIDFTVDFGFELGNKFAFSWAKPEILLEKYEKTGFSKDKSPSYELILKY